jgi:hypothetical protein
MLQLPEIKPRRFKAPSEIVQLRELEKWSYARRDFWTFRQCIHPDLIIGTWPRQISRHLQRFYKKLAAGKRPKLVISSPPQHGKSLAVTDFMAWAVGLNPDLKTIFASYSDALGERASIDLQRILNSDVYIKIFGRTRGYLGEYRFDDGSQIWLWHAFDDRHGA